ncbi:MAG: PilZ domain-containing protein [Methylobacteriaceae bacterium]|nr:PilZ domain-containing protein [Methylobacteriaceae bacterium]MBV9222339.1 PilZ domain-containing protein [Methylobacteriaceae bacterium]MBV9243487.1 PilZ domain-containing protein [Methylobacteriaceae bacterium]MBV9633059.1 PilZ domain-containing protein [Methylobacteriaceae bacterium]MBV9704019.1 PilZ domain-containing protein [Methylobacteriaceae bacterium]
MNPATTAIAKTEARPVERRRYQRVKVALLGRYMLRDRREFPCQTIDMSPGGVALLAPMPGAVGERVVVYLDHVGRIEGHVARHMENGFAMSVTAPLLKREKLADQLTWLANRHALGLPEDRRHERIVPRVTRTVVTLADGHELIAKIIDVSISGVAVAVDVKPPVGSAITVGQTMGRVVRTFDGGIAVEFSRLLPAETFGDDVRL